MLHADLAALCRRSPLCLSPSITRRFQLQNSSTHEVTYEMLFELCHRYEREHVAYVQAVTHYFHKQERPQRENKHLSVWIFFVC